MNPLSGRSPARPIRCLALVLVVLAVVPLVVLVGCGPRPLPAPGAAGYTPRFTDLQPRTVPLDSITLSDPFILADPGTRTYYMTGSGGQLWKSRDLRIWEGPHNFVEFDTTSWMGSRPAIWAAELHAYDGRYYSFLTFTNRDVIVDTVPANPVPGAARYLVQRRASHVLVSDRPEGPYRPIRPGVHYTPPAHSTLDGTLWVEDGVPYMVYCHEWMQLTDGTMVAVELAPDLSEPVGPPFTLFRGSDGPWVREMRSIGEITFGMDLNGWVTDGPFLFRTGTGRLGMLWSAWGDERYTQGVAYSESGRLAGPWVHEPAPMNTANSGHGMLFRAFDGRLVMALHTSPTEGPSRRRPVLLEMDDSGHLLRIVGPFQP
jgi:hypothetical protein